MRVVHKGRAFQHMYCLLFGASKSKKIQIAIFFLALSVGGDPGRVRLVCQLLQPAGHLTTSFIMNSFTHAM